MASSTPTRILVLVSTVTCLFFAFNNKFGRAYDEHRFGAAGVVADEYVPEAIPEPEEEGSHNPDLVFTKALECFNDRYIYSSCDEEYRLTRNGELDVPHEYVDQYCEGPCLKETGLVLDCVEEIFKHFLFYNKASVHDVRETIKTGCGYGPKRGNFNVAEHVRVDEDIAGKLSASAPVYATVVMMIMGWNVLL